MPSHVHQCRVISDLSRPALQTSDGHAAEELVSLQRKAVLVWLASLSAEHAARLVGCLVNGACDC